MKTFTYPGSQPPTLAKYNNAMFAGFNNASTNQAWIFKSRDGINWKQIYTLPTERVGAFEVFNNRLYMGTSPNGAIYVST